MTAVAIAEDVDPTGDPPVWVPETPRVGIVLSRGIRKLPNLAMLTGLESVLTPAESRRRCQPGDVVLVWGRKSSGQRAIRYAVEQSLPVWYLEDGWIRSSAADAHGRQTYSLLLDRDGVYYDSTCESSLERYLNRAAEEFHQDCDEAAGMYARANREFLVQHRISKYNYCRQTPISTIEALAGDRGLVLVIDQTRDDASVRYGAMNEKRFESMLVAAIEENPAHRVVVRTHPDVMAGRRRGYLHRLAARYAVAVVGGDDNPFDWIRSAERVYTGTSQLGYEALLAGRPVSVFGQPFYAGWGLTDDRQPVERRRATRRLDELFHATHVHYARYCSPITGERWQLHDCLEHVALQQSMFVMNARRFRAVGITPWKRRYVRQYLRSPDGSLCFGKPVKGRAEKSADETLVTWGFRRYAERGTEQAHRVWRLEDGFLRSTGLGSDFTAPGSLVLDTRGLYFDPGCESDLERLLNHHDCRPEDIARAARLRRRIITAGVSKYNGGERGFELSLPADRLCVVVSGQVEDDESVRRGCDEITTNSALLQAARKCRPDAWIVYRPHPDVLSGNRRGIVDPFTLQSCADQVDTSSAIVDCIESAHEWHTMTSLSGFEALLRGRKVVTYGAPFYAGWGLTEDHRPTRQRTRGRTLDELVYLSLIAYPRYLDIDSGEFINAETMVSLIERQRAERAGSESRPGRLEHQWLKLRNLYRGLTYAP